jgi:hypothetical protein
VSTTIAKTGLSEPRRRLVELMQALNFGRVENLPVRDGEPVLDPLPRRVREVKFASENGPRPERAAAAFLLKAQVIELFQLLDELRDGVIQVIEVKHGLPFRVLVAECDA